MKKYNGYGLVTGGDGGIGYCIAEKLAMNGYNLLLVARDEAALNKAKDHFENKYKVEVLTLIKDLTEANSSREVYEYVQEKGIHIALLVNNAGFGSWGPFEESKHESIVNMVELQCRAVTELTHFFVPDMIKKGEGGIIIVSSFVSRIHMANFAVYVACKAFESNLGTILNFELKSKNIDVLVVSPAVTKTKFYHQSKELHKKVEAAQTNLLGLKYNTPENVAECAVKNLGKKIEIVTGSFLDKFFFYSGAFTPLVLQRIILHLYFKYIYKTTY